MDTSGSSIVISELEFMSYRVVSMEIKTRPTVGMLFTSIESDANWQLGLGFSDITFEEETGIYIVPLSLRMRLLQMDDLPALENDESYLSARATISGAFRFAQNCTMTPELKNRLIRQQAPAILLSYLRATVSTMLVSAGFGGVIIPLMNVFEMAGKNKPVEIIPVSKQNAEAPTPKAKKKKKEK